MEGGFEIISNYFLFIGWGSKFSDKGSIIFSLSTTLERSWKRDREKKLNNGPLNAPQQQPPEQQNIFSMFKCFNSESLFFVRLCSPLVALYSFLTLSISFLHPSIHKLEHCVPFFSEVFALKKWKKLFFWFFVCAHRVNNFEQKLVVDTF